MNLLGRKSTTIFTIVAAIIITFGSTPLIVADPNNYQQGFKAGLHDELNHVLHQNKLGYDKDGNFSPWSNGYLAGWHKSCDKLGIENNAPDSMCNLLMDRGTP